MQRLLALLLSVAVIATATVRPVLACAPGTAVGGPEQHGCCTEQFISPAPAGTCCTVSQPLRDRAVTVSRYVTAGDRHLAPAVVHHAAWMAAGGLGPQRTVSLPTAPTPRLVPIYLQQLALRI